MSEAKGWLSLAMEAAREAGEILDRKLTEPREVAYKAKRSMVTDADYAAQELIVRRIREAFPDHDIMSEEMKNRDQPLADPVTPLWIIDPLDGTTNYAHRWPSYCVSIAISLEGSVAAGAVYDPNLEELFHGLRGAGAYLNGSRLKVSDAGDLEESLMAMNWPYEHHHVARASGLLAYLVPRVGTMRSTGSAALSLCYVAAGRADFYFHPRLNAWDVAAAGLILSEAGGTLTDFQGRPWALDSEECLGTNGLLFGEVVGGIASGEAGR